MADPTFNEQMVEKYKTALLAVPAGVTSTTIDGVVVSYTDLMSQLQKWEARVASEAGLRPRVLGIRLDRG